MNQLRKFQVRDLGKGKRPYDIVFHLGSLVYASPKRYQDSREATQWANLWEGIALMVEGFKPFDFNQWVLVDKK